MVYFIDGVWSFVRSVVFFIIKMDGILDIWDFVFKYCDFVFSLKVMFIFSFLYI